MTSVFSETDLKKREKSEHGWQRFSEIMFVGLDDIYSLSICFGNRLKDEDVKEEKPGLYLL